MRSISAISGETKNAFSDYKYNPKDGEEPGLKFLSIYGKPGVTRWNLAMISLTLFITMFADTDFLQEILFLLQDPEFYDQHGGEAKTTANSSTSIATFVGIAAFLSSGFIFDMLGRKKTLMGCLILSGISIVLFPVLAPYKAAFYTLRVMF